MLDSVYSGKFRQRRDKQLYDRACFWYDELFKIACHCFVLDGAPDTVNVDYVNYMLMVNGSLIMQRPTNTGKFPDGVYILNGVREGIDPYGFPVRVGIVNHAVKSPIGENGLNAFWIRSNSDARPAISIINEYAEQLAMLDVGISTNIFNTYTSRVFRVRNQAQAQQVRKMYDSITSGEPAVIQRNGILDETDQQTWIINNETKYYVHDYLDDQDRIIARFMAEFGIESQPVEKKERNITPEFKVKLRELSVKRAYWLDARNRDLERANKYFNTNMTFKIREIDDSELKMLDYHGTSDEMGGTNIDTEYQPRDTRPADI